MVEQLHYLKKFDRLDDVVVDHDLVVIGGGAAGLAASTMAAELGLSVILVESFNLFGTIGTSPFRRIEPFLYDWPLVEDNPPREQPVGPLPLFAAKPGQLAERWLRVVEGKLKKFSQFSIEQPAWGEVVAETESHVDVIIRRGSRSRIVKATRVIQCTGASERLKLKSGWSGLPFWDFDDLSKPDYGFSDGAAGKRIVVSGGGDGAIQDVLRCLFGDEHVANIQRALVEHMSAKDQLAVAKAEQHFRQIYTISCVGMNRREHDALTELEAVYTRSLQQVAGNNRFCVKMKNLLRQNRPEVELIIPCHHFGVCYPLNRLSILVTNLLFGKEGTKQKGCLILKTECWIDDALRKHPKGLPWGDPTHDVWVSDGASCMGPDPEQVASLEMCNAYLPRHGLLPGGDAPSRRQNIPVHPFVRSEAS